MREDAGANLNEPIIRLFGQVRLVGHASRAAGSPRQACVLVALASPPGCPVSLDTLTARLWGTNPPRTARATLYVYVARLRKLIAAFGLSIDAASGSYLLRAAPARVDLYALRAKADEARRRRADNPRATVRLLAEALDLCHGEPLIGVGGEWAERVRCGLADEHLSLRLLKYDAELELGRHDAIIDELRSLAAHFPHSESLASLRMRAAYQRGDLVEALDFFQELRLRLREELGTEPGRQLRELHRRMLRDDLRPLPTFPSAA